MKNSQGLIIAVCLTTSLHAPLNGQEADHAQSIKKLNKIIALLHAKIANQEERIIELEKGIADGSITSEKIADGAISSKKIADSAVKTQHLSTHAIQATHIQNKTITGDHIQSNSLTSDHIQDKIITNRMIAHDSIEAEQIKDGAVTLKKLSSNLLLPTSNILYSSNNTQTLNDYLSKSLLNQKHCFLKNSEQCPTGYSAGTICLDTEDKDNADKLLGEVGSTTRSECGQSSTSFNLCCN